MEVHSGEKKRERERGRKKDRKKGKKKKSKAATYQRLHNKTETWEHSPPQHNCWRAQISVAGSRLRQLALPATRQTNPASSTNSVYLLLLHQALVYRAEGAVSKEHRFLPGHPQEAIPIPWPSQPASALPAALVCLAEEGACHSALSPPATNTQSDCFHKSSRQTVSMFRMECARMERKAELTCAQKGFACH